MFKHLLRALMENGDQQIHDFQSRTSHSWLDTSSCSDVADSRQIEESREINNSFQGKGEELRAYRVDIGVQTDVD